MADNGVDEAKRVIDGLSVVAEAIEAELSKVEEYDALCFPSVSAVFCDDKLDKQCKRYGLKLGFAMDLRTGYDFRFKADQE